MVEFGYLKKRQIFPQKKCTGILWNLGCPLVLGVPCDPTAGFSDAMRVNADEQCLRCCTWGHLRARSRGPCGSVGLRAALLCVYPWVRPRKQSDPGSEGVHFRPTGNGVLLAHNAVPVHRVHLLGRWGPAR